MREIDGRPLVIEPARGRRFSIRCRPGEPVVLRVPRAMPLTDALRELVRHWPKIQRRLSRIPEGLVHTPRTFDPGERLLVLGKTITLREHDTRQSLRAFVAQTVGEEARLLAVKMCGTIGARFDRIQIKHYRARLGSCSRQKLLQFHWGIGLLPREMFQSVVAHEVAHLKHANHGRGFWQTVCLLSPEARAHHKVLRLIAGQLRF